MHNRKHKANPKTLLAIFTPFLVYLNSFSSLDKIPQKVKTTSFKAIKFEFEISVWYFSSYLLKPRRTFPLTPPQTQESSFEKEEQLSTTRSSTPGKKLLGHDFLILNPT